MTITKRTRYEVLRRDNHTCRYCGGRAPDVVLTVDHVIPQALGGTDDPANLVAACKDCNAGKAASNPDAPLVAQVADDAIRWAAAMRHAAGKIRDDIQADEEYAEALEEVWSRYWYGDDQKSIPRPLGWRISLNAFRAAGLPADLMADSAERALSNDRILAADTWKYFCGIAWKRVSELQATAAVALRQTQEDAAEDDTDPYWVGYSSGYWDAREKADRRYSALQFAALCRVADAEAMQWVAALNGS